MEPVDLRRRVGAILDAEERQPADWNAAASLTERLRQDLAVGPAIEYPQIVRQFLDDADIRVGDDDYANLQRQRIRQFVDRGEYTDSISISWLVFILVTIFAVGLVYFWLL